MLANSDKSFHLYKDRMTSDYFVHRPGGRVITTTVQKHFIIQQRKLKYRFLSHFHPYVAQLIERLLQGSVAGLQAEDTNYLPGQTLPDGSPRPRLYAELFTTSAYKPSDMVTAPHPVKDLDFTADGPYSVYNWELFYHVPFTIALHLSKNQRFEEAMRWFHMVFDPTDDGDGDTPQRFWKVKPFQTTDVHMVEDVLVNLATGADPALRVETIRAIGAWKDAPFRPHAVARFRQSAYMLKTVMAYLDNLIAAGDALFRQDTREAINEATQYYVNAANILGARPQAVPKKGSVRPQTYANLRSDLDAFGNALRELETDIPFDIVTHPGDASDADRFEVLRSLGHALYFCIPRNDKLLSYWDVVADRLFKIRNSLNIQGVFRQLPLFEPPIDPALLARAAAAGLDVGAVVSGANQPLPLVRFQPLVQKAVEICQEVKGLAAQLLAAIEKEDGEALAILRARHEKVALSIAETVKYQQWQEAIKSREGIEKSLAAAAHRYGYYERLLGRDANSIDIPTLDDVDRDALTKMKFSQTEPVLAPRDIVIAIDPGGQVLAEGAKLSPHEVAELTRLDEGQHWAGLASIMDILAAAMNVIPGFGISIQPFGVGGTISFGGSNIAAIFQAISAGMRGESQSKNYQASRTAKIGGYLRREQEWGLQSNLAAAEITQAFKQLRAAQIRESIAEREWRNHQTQIEHAREMESFLSDEKNGKKSNRAFYAWLKREVKGLYADCFQFAFDVARKAERALQHELGDPSLSFLRLGYLGGREGLLAGEKLLLDVKRMEMAYHDLNQREYEMTKHVSLAQLDPRALMELRAIGRCKIALPEEVFDLDAPGQYFRRLRSVAVSVPCVAGPYTSVNCRLTLTKSSVRKNALLLPGNVYARENAEDPRFSDHFGSLQTIVTSTAQNDDGVFSEGRDERRAPFEGSGAISEWELVLPGDVRQFDYDTIADVILHIRYTAREGGDLLRGRAVANLEARIAEARALGSVRLISVRHEFAAAWARFVSTPIAAGTRGALEIDLRPEHYPFWSRGRLASLTSIDVFARSSQGDIDFHLAPTGTAHDTLTPQPDLNGLHVGAFDTLPLPAPTGVFTLYFDDNAFEDIWLAVGWSSTAS